MTEWSDLVIAVCAVLGFVAVIIGAAFGYGAFRGAARSEARHAKEATTRMFEQIHELAERHEHDHKRHEKIIQTLRDVLVREGFLVTADTNVGKDGRGVKVPR